MTTIAVKVARKVWYFIAALIVLAAVLVSFSRLLTPFINSHRADFEAQASQLLDLPVTIGHIHVSWNIFRPQLSFDQVSISDKDTHKLISQVQRINVRVSLLSSLFHRKIVLDRLKIIGVQLVLRQQPGDKVNLEGFGDFPLTENVAAVSSTQKNGVIAWIFSEANLVLDDVNVRYVPLKGKEKFFTLNSLSLNNNGTSHTLNGQVVLHQAVSTTATLGLQWKGDVTDLAHVSAQGYLYLEAISLPQWLAQQSLDGVRVNEGLGSAKIWATWDRGQWKIIQTKFQVYELELQSLATKQTEVISRLSGRIDWKRNGNTQEFSGDDILIDFPKHLWPTTHFSGTLAPAPDGTLMLKSLHVGYLDLGEVKDIAQLTDSLPDQMKKWIKDLDPSGDALGLTLNLQSPLTIENVSFFSGFSGLSFKSVGKFPGVNHAAGVFSWDGKQGSIKLDSQQTSFTLDSIFLRPLQFDHVLGVVQFQKETADEWVVTAKNFQVSNADAKAHVELSLKLPANDSPFIDLTGDFSVANGPKLIDYLPLKIWDIGVNKWLKAAVLSGQVTSGKAILQGRLSEFPFDQGAGKFLIVGNIKDVDLNYAPEWPVLQRVNGSVTFSNSTMMVDVDSAELLNTPLTDIHATIPYIGNDAPQYLELETTLKTDFANALQFIQKSPLRKTLGKDLAGVTLTGAMQLKLGLSVPLGKPDDASVDGEISTPSANLAVSAWTLSLDKIKGSFNFTEDSLDANHLQGVLLGEPADLTITTVHPKGQSGVVKVVLQSQLHVPVLQKWLKLPLDRIFNGGANYSAELDLVSHTDARPVKVTIRSDLQGVSVALPSPYGKTAGEKKNIELALSASEGRIAEADLKLENWLSADIRFQPVDNVLRVDLNGEKMQGTVTLPLDQSRSSLTGRFKRISLSSMADKSSSSSINPASLPALDFIVENVYYDNKNLGRVTLNTEPSKTGLLIRRLNIDSKQMTTKAYGEWRSQGGNRTYFRGTFTTPNVSAFLNSWDLKSSNLVESGATLTFDLNWQGAPYSPAIAKLNGNIAVNLTKGRIIDLGSSTDTKIGFGRMLNLFSLQTIPRRLSLDFSDLFEKGYSFDSMKGDFKLENGNAFTHNAYFEGPIARVDIDGRVGLANKDYNLTLGVTPFVTSSLPVVAAIASGPAAPLAFLATWVVEKVVTREVASVVTYHYEVTGPWDSPTWKEISKSAAKAAVQQR